MDKQKKNAGITLIALVISIIVMLILAGVSINMTIGDNGIITNAMDAKVKTGIAVIEEYLNEFYASHYEDISKDEENKALALSNYSVSSDWFLKTANGYLVDKNGKAHCFLIIENMPSEVSESVVGGRGEGKEIGDYIAGNDVYGVTSDLKVYYCRNGIDSGIGYAYDDLPFENPEKVVFSANNAWAKLINGDGEQKDLTVADMKSVTNLEITETSGISSLADLYNFTSLKSITLRNITMDTLDGLDNARDLQYLYMENINVADYKAMSKLTKLQTLYVERNGKTKEQDNTTINNILTSMAGVDYSSLGTIGIFGTNLTNAIEWSTGGGPSDYNTTIRSEISDISAFQNLTETTKKAIKKIYFNNNKLTDLTPIEMCSNVDTLRIDSNNLTNLNFITKMSKIINLHVANNLLNDISIFSQMNTENKPFFNKMTFLSLASNSNLINCSSIINLSGLTRLYLNACLALNVEDVQVIADFYNTRTYKSIDSRYNDYLQGTTKRIYDNKNLADTSPQITAMQALSSADKQKIKQISLVNNSKLTDACLNNLLNSGFSNLVSLDLTGCSLLTRLDFLEGLPKLQELRIRNTGIVGNEVSEIDAHCPSLVSISANTAIDLTAMQKTLSNLKSGNREFEFCKERWDCFIVTPNITSQLPSCTNITQLSMFGTAEFSTTELDLSGCTKLSSINLYGPNVKIKLPSSITNVYIQSSKIPDFSNCINKVTTITGQHWVGNSKGTDFTAMCQQLSNSTSLTTISLTPYNATFDWSGLKYLSKSNIKTISITRNGSTADTSLVLDSIKNIDLRKDDTYVEGTPHFDKLTSLTFNYCSLENLDNYKDCKNLQTISITDSKSLKDISALENMPNLTTVNFSGDERISSLYGLRNAKQLTTLNLNNNSVYNSVFDEKARR